MFLRTFRVVLLLVGFIFGAAFCVHRERYSGVIQAYSSFDKQSEAGLAARAARDHSKMPFHWLAVVVDNHFLVFIPVKKREAGEFQCRVKKLVWS